MKLALRILPFLLLISFLVHAQHFVDGQMIVKLKSGQSVFLKYMDENFPDLQTEIIESISTSSGLYLVSFNESEALLISEDPVVFFNERTPLVYAQRNHTNIELRSSPNDPSFAVQWNLIDLNAELAWDITTGGMTTTNEEIVVAVVDNSFQIEHDDLKPNLWKNIYEIPGDGIDNDSNGYVDDYDGWNAYEDTGRVYVTSSFGNRNHGSMVMGMIGARTNNLTDISSVNWNIKMMPIMGSSTIESYVLKAYGYVLDARKRYNRTNGDSGAYVVAMNSSFGLTDKPANYPAWCDMFDQLGKEGVISTGAGPNNNVNIDVVGDIPCSCPSDYLIAVTSSGSDRKLYGGFGSTHMDLGAPGQNVLSTNSTNGIAWDNGTSFASPMVAGAIALMYSVVPKDTMLAYSNKQDSLALMVRSKFLEKGWDSASSFQGVTATGGILNLYKAVLAAMDSTANSVSEFEKGQSRIKLYPNPSIDKAYLDFSGLEVSVDLVQVLSISGKIVSTIEKPASTRQEIDLQNFPKGLYLVQLYLKDGVKTIKLLRY